MPLMAFAAQQAGATAIRANSVRDIIQIREKVNIPIIGLIKKSYPPLEQFITVTMDEVDQLVAAGTDMIAMDCTDRLRFNGESALDFIKKIKRKYPEQLIMADISTYEEGLAAEDAGVDAISTTLNGYTQYTEQDLYNGPNYGLVYHLSRKCSIPVIAEGRIHYPWQAKKMFSMGAWSVVVGSAITRPYEITRRFVECLVGERDRNF